MSLISNLIFCFRQKIHLQCIPTTFISFCNSLTEPLKCKKNSSDEKSNQKDDECNRNSVLEAVLPKPGKQSYDCHFFRITAVTVPRNTNFIFVSLISSTSPLVTKGTTAEEDS